MLASKKQWGQTAWNFMHILACKIKEEEFYNHKVELIYIVKSLCANLPCHDCRMHAEKQMKGLNVSSIRCKEDFVSMLHDFHNKVNARTNKPLFKKEDLKIYNEMSTRNVVVSFMNTWYAGSSTPRLMMDTFARVQFLKHLREYFDKYSGAFRE
jgi:hypothetical protein